MKNRHWDS